MFNKKEPVPYAATQFEDYHVYAIKALEKGAATPEQQKLFLHLLLNGVCQTYNLSYHPNNERDSCFAEGKRFVGLEIVRALNKDMTKKREKPYDGTKSA